MKMKNVSNIAAAVGAAVVLVSFALKAAGLTSISMAEAGLAAGFIKAMFLPVDASVWLTNIFGKRKEDGNVF
jgi:hypothetical protein